MDAPEGRYGDHQAWNGRSERRSSGDSERDRGGAARRTRSARGTARVARASCAPFRSRTDLFYVARRAFELELSEASETRQVGQRRLRLSPPRPRPARSRGSAGLTKGLSRLAPAHCARPVPARAAAAPPVDGESRPNRQVKAAPEAHVPSLPTLQSSESPDTRPAKRSSLRTLHPGP